MRALSAGLGGGLLGGIVGGLNVRKKEADVTLAVVNVRTTEQEALAEGYARKTDVSVSGGYQNTDIGQVVVLAYLDAYTRLGGLPANASTAAPRATR